MECTHINDVARDQMTRMVEAGHFDLLPAEEEKKATKRNPRKVSAFVAVEDESESEGEDEKLALPNLEELLREQGYIQLNVGAEKAWDGNTVSEFGFGCLHVGCARALPEPNEVVFAGAGDELIGSLSEWILVKGKNKNKTVSKKIPPVSPPNQASKRPVWLKKLSNKNVPRLHAKKMPDLEETPAGSSWIPSYSYYFL